MAGRPRSHDKLPLNHRHKECIIYYVLQICQLLKNYNFLDPIYILDKIERVIQLSLMLPILGSLTDCKHHSWAKTLTDFAYELRKVMMCNFTLNKCSWFCCGGTCMKMNLIKNYDFLIIGRRLHRRKWKVIFLIFFNYPYLIPC